MVAGIFQVQDLDNNWVNAKFLQVNGQYVTDPNSQNAQSFPMQDLNGTRITNPNSYLIVPADYDVSKAMDYGNQLRAMMLQGGTTDTPLGVSSALNKLANDFRSGKPQDLQTNYNGQTNVRFVRAFTDAASYHLGGFNILWRYTSHLDVRRWRGL